MAALHHVVVFAVWNGDEDRKRLCIPGPRRGLVVRRAAFVQRGYLRLRPLLPQFVDPVGRSIPSSTMRLPLLPLLLAAKAGPRRSSTGPSKRIERPNMVRIRSARSTHSPIYGGRWSKFQRSAKVGYLLTGSRSMESPTKLRLEPSRALLQDNPR